jgi:hypothetical protein
MFTKRVSKSFHAAIGAGILASIFMVGTAGAEDFYDGHAFVRASILNTWKSTAVASATAQKVDAQERARQIIVGTPTFARATVGAAAVGSPVDGHDQARKLLLGQPQYVGPGGTILLSSFGDGS